MSTSEKTKQVGIVLVTHGNYGQSLLDAAQTILGKQPGCAAVGVDISQEVGEILANIRDAVQKSDLGGGVLILTDMFGGTPTNLSLSLLGTGRLEVMTGVNLPMLLKVMGSRGISLGKLAQDAKTAGCQGIVVAGDLLRSKVAETK
jgi:PTS system mannose-specific IIA component